MMVPTATSCVNPSPWNKHGEGWRGRPLVSTSTGIEPLNFLGSVGGQVADPMIEADFFILLIIGHSLFTWILANIVFLLTLNLAYALVMSPFY
jgi:hypothetical protein